MSLSLEQMMELTEKEQKVIYQKVKNARGPAKNTNYAAQYGAGPPKISLTAGVPIEVARILHKAYWDENWALKAIAEDQDIKEIGGELWLKNPINGFYYSLRNKKDITNTLVQGTASYVFDIWVNYVTMKYDEMLAQFHDEGVWQIEDTPESKKQMEEILRWAIDETNNFLKLNRQLDIDIQYGYAYSEIH